MRVQPCGKTAQIAGKRGEASGAVGGDALVICGSDAGNDKRLVDIHTATDGIDNLEHRHNSFTK